MFPSHYDMFVGGVAGAGETYDEAALREAEEELERRLDEWKWVPDGLAAYRKIRSR